MVAICEIVDPSDVETRRLRNTDLARRLAKQRSTAEACQLHAADHIRRLVEQFDTEHKLVRDLTLQHPTDEPIVLIGGAGVDPVAPAPVGRPVAEVLLHPNGHECVSPTSTKPASGIARGRLQQRVDGHRWDPACLVLLDEAVLDPKFRITGSQL